MQDDGTPSPATILLVEDDPDDRWLLRKHLADRSRVPFRMVEAPSALAALDYLNHRGAYGGDAAAPRPCLIILDLYLDHRPEGLELLRTLKADDRLRSIPVIVFSVSDSDDFVAQAYDEGAAAFIPKSSRSINVSRAVESISRFWLECACLPR